uniref:VPS37 C-terminal domain-containing protein n=1 Tax=Syphacia muris TaxID=451379 RepID=A0A0N5AXF4_9BILA
MADTSFESLLEAAVAAAVSSIRSFSYEKLNELLSDNAELDKIVDNVPEVHSLPEQRDLFSVQNKSLSEYNLSQEPQLEAAKAKFLNTYEEVKKLKDEVLAMKSKLDIVSEQRSLDTLSAVLQAAAQKADDESEEIANRYLNSEIEVEQFLEQFMEKRSLAQMRKIKSERLLAILRQQQYPQSSSSSNSIYKQGNAGGIPYPVETSGIYPQPTIPSRSYWSQTFT